MSEPLIGDYQPGEIDPVLDAIRQSLVDAGAPGSALAEFGANQIVVVAPEETEQSLDAKIQQAMAKNKGLCLLLVGGSATNPNKEEEGPVIILTLEAQLFVSTRIRGKGARPVMELICEICRFLHLARIRPSSAHWNERIFFTGFTPMQDPDFTAYILTFEREITL